MEPCPSGRGRRKPRPEPMAGRPARFVSPFQGPGMSWAAAAHPAWAERAGADEVRIEPRYQPILRDSIPNRRGVKTGRRKHLAPGQMAVASPRKRCRLRSRSCETGRRQSCRQSDTVAAVQTWAGHCCI